MHIVVLNDTGYVDGGAAQVAVSALNDLAAMGHRVTFIAHHGPFADQIDRSRVELKALAKSDQVSTTVLIRLFSGLFNLVTFIKMFLFLRTVGREDTVVHLHSWTKYLSSSPVLACKLLKIPILVTLHDYFTCCPNGGFFNYPKNRICTARPLGLECLATNCDSRSWAVKVYRVVRQLVQNQVVRLPKFAAGFVAVSAYSEKILRKHLPPGKQIFRISNPVIITRPGKGRASSLEKHVVSRDKFTFVGRLSPEKGPEVFLRASRLAGVRPTIVGDGVLYDRLKLLYPEANFMGWRSPRELQEILTTSIAMVFPSLWHETHGLVVSEAMACGTPVIVSRNCAAADLVEDRRTGLIFSSGDVRDLARCLTVLRTDYDLANEMSKSCTTTFDDMDYSTVSHAKGLIQAYEKLIENRKRKFVSY